MRTRIAKECMLALIAIAFSILNFWSWYRAIPLIAGGSFRDYTVLLSPAATLVGSACLFSLSAIFVSSRWLMYGASLLAGLAALVFIPWSVPLFGACIASSLLALFAGRRMSREYASSITFSTSKILKAGLPIYFTAACVAISLFYYQEISNQERTTASIVPRSAVELSLTFLSGAVSDLGGIRDANSALTVDEFLSRSLATQIGSQGKNARKIPQKEIAELMVNQRNQLARRYGIHVNGNERLVDVLHRTITAKVEELLGPYARFLPFLSSLAFFFALRTLTFALYFVAVVITALLITILRRATILKNEQREITVERLTL